MERGCRQRPDPTNQPTNQPTGSLADSDFQIDRRDRLLTNKDIWALIKELYLKEPPDIQPEALNYPHPRAEEIANSLKQDRAEFVTELSTDRSLRLATVLAPFRGVDAIEKIFSPEQISKIAEINEIVHEANCHFPGAPPFSESFLITEGPASRAYIHEDRRKLCNQAIQMCNEAINDSDLVAIALETRYRVERNLILAERCRELYEHVVREGGYGENGRSNAAALGCILRTNCFCTPELAYVFGLGTTQGGGVLGRYEPMNLEGLLLVANKSPK